MFWRALLVPSLIGLGTALLSGTALAETRTYNESGFTSVKARQSIEVIFTSSETFKVEADVEGDAFERLIVERRGDALVLERPKRRGGWLRGGNRNQPKITVYVSAPTLSAVQVSSSASFKGDQLTNDALALSASSSGQISLAEISAGAFQPSASSSGTIEIGGTCTSLDANASSSGRILGEELTCQNADINASSSGRVKLALDGGAADLNLSSSAQTDLTGSCSYIEISTSSGAEVNGRALTCAALDARASSGANIDVSITGEVEARASSGADIDIYGTPTAVDQSTSSGGDIDVHRAL